MKILLSISAMLLLGCGSAPTPMRTTGSAKHIQVSDARRVEQTLIRAADQIAKSHALLAQSRNALASELLTRADKVRFMEEHTKTPPGFEKKVSIRHWYGPLRAAVERIAELTGYQILVRGQQSQVNVKIDQENTAVFEIFKELKYQAGLHGVAVTTSHKGNRIIYVAYP